MDETAPEPVDANSSDQALDYQRWHFPSWGQAAVLATATAFTPSRVWAANMAEVGFPDGLILWTGIMWLIGLGMWLVIVRIGAEPIGVTYALFWSLLAFGSLGSLADRVPGGSGTLVVATIALAVAAYFFRRLTPFELWTSWAVVTAVILPLGLATASLMSRGESQVAAPTEVAFQTFDRKPDVVILVLDSFGSLETLERWYDLDSGPMIRAFEDNGVSVEPEMKANYTLTHLSLASFFEMDYPVDQGVRVGDAEWVDLLRSINGENQLVDVFRSQGYRFVMIESGWQGIRCGGSEDVCVRGVWPDSITVFAIDRSLFGGLGLLRSPPTIGALHSIAWLQDELGGLLENNVPELVFAHLLIPHPPLLLDSDCRYNWMPGMGGLVVVEPETAISHIPSRKLAYVEQTRCAQRLILEIAQIADGRALLLAFGDHGPDSQGQLFKAPEDWTPDDVEERSQILLATSIRGCGDLKINSLVNLGRSIISCLSGSNVDHVDDRLLIAVSSKRPDSAVGEPLLEVDFGR